MTIVENMLRIEIKEMVECARSIFPALFSLYAL